MNLNLEKQIFPPFSKQCCDVAKASSPSSDRVRLNADVRTVTSAKPWQQYSVAIAVATWCIQQFGSTATGIQAVC